LSEATGAAPLTEEGERLTVAQFPADTQEAPHYAWPVLRDANYYYADPLTNPDLLEPSYTLTVTGTYWMASSPCAAKRKARPHERSTRR